MHGTVEIDAWEALAMGVQDIFDVSGVGDIGSTLVVYDDVKALIPVRIFVGSEDRLGLFVGESLVVDIDEIDGHDGVKTRLNAVLKDVFLREVIVAATAGDNKDAEGCLLGEESGEAGQECQGEGGAEFHGVVME